VHQKQKDKLKDCYTIIVLLQNQKYKQKYLEKPKKTCRYMLKEHKDKQKDCERNVQRCLICASETDRQTEKL
jgi:hypothetical protein